MEFLFVVIIILAICFYFLPTIIASIRHSEHGTAIFWVNLLFGWTVLGWIATLIWAAVEKVEDRIVAALRLPADQHAGAPEPSPATESQDRSTAWYVGLFATAFAVMTLLAWLFKGIEK